MKKTLRNEYTLTKERRERSINSLIKEAVINILAEQELNPAGVTSQPAPPASSPAPADTQPPQDVLPPPPEQDPVPKQYTVDDMIQELNAIRSGRSFTDPEIYGRLVTFFKNVSEDQKAILDQSLKQIADLVTSVDDEASVNQQNFGAQNNNAQPSPEGAPQQSAPMPGAQQNASLA